MMELVVQLNAWANFCGRYLLAPLALLPGWLSATLVAAVTGLLMLLIFKYTSPQRRVKHVRDGIKANLLALSLFKDHVGVSLRCQGRVLSGAGHLLLLALIPMAVMTVPMCLLLAQLALWYQARPLHVGEEAVLSVHMRPEQPFAADAQLQPTPAAAVTVGPVRAPRDRMICLNLRAEQEGYHQLTLEVDGKPIQKELAVGDGLMRVSSRKPARDWMQALLHPGEPPVSADSPVQFIEIDYPSRRGWTSGTGSWLIYWFVASMAVAFCARPWLKVNI